MAFKAHLVALSRKVIHLCYFKNMFDQREHRIVGNSWQDEFCAIGLLRGRIIETQKTESVFVFVKAMVAPMKVLSIPKLKLQAAMLVFRLKEDILRLLSIFATRTFLWTDCITVLQWLHSVDKLPTFVANRVCEIKELTTMDQWFHVKSGDNPADNRTRNKTSECFKKHLDQGPKLPTQVLPHAYRSDNRSGDLAIAKGKLLCLNQSEFFPVEFKQLQPGIPIKSPCRNAGYPPFISVPVSSVVPRDGFIA